MDNALDSTTNKLIILFVFDAMGMPLEEDTIVNICYYDLACMQYIDCKEALVNLLDANLIFNTSSSSGKTTFAITRDGSECLGQFFTRIPGHYRDEILEYSKKNRLKVRKQQEYFRDYYKNDDGSYTVILRIMDKTVTAMELKLVVSNRNNAKWIVKNWCDKAAQVYGMLNDILMEN